MLAPARSAAALGLRAHRSRPTTTTHATTHATKPATPPPTPWDSRWDRGYAARANDDTVASAVDALFAREHSSGFIAATPSTPISVGDAVEIQLVPQRKSYAHGAGCSCPFCQPVDTRQRAVQWRGWQVLANAFPYAPHHLVIASASHAPQSIDRRIVLDMIDLQRALGPTTTLHYNGIAGNSQPHRHWQGTRERLPLTRLLDADALALAVVRRDSDAEVRSFDDGFFAGLLVTGTPAGVARNAARLADALERDEQTRGCYNMLLLPMRDNQVRLVVIPRNADHIAVDAGVLGTVRLGAFDLAGRGVLARESVSADGVAAFLDAAARSVVRPQHLAWLSSFGRAPSSDAVSLRLWQAPAGASPGDG
ncbi:MAG TPA: DUF4922 domain-containing protein [Myxococcota bacterium]|jgi:hypothetical protein